MPRKRLSRYDASFAGACGILGYGTYVEGDTATYWLRSQYACFEAITAVVFFHRASGQSHGLDWLESHTGVPVTNRPEHPNGTATLR